MKYKISLLSLLSLSAMAEGHWYVGAGVGTTMGDSVAHGKETILNVAPYGYSTSQQKLFKSSLAGQFQAGYFKKFNTFFALGEAFAIASHNKASGSDRFNDDADPNEQIVSTLTKTSTMGVSAKIGLPVHEKWGIFANMSVLRAKFKFDHGFIDPNPSNNQSSSRTVTTWGVSPGLGAIYHISPKMPLRLEYNYEIYKTLKARQFYVPATTDSTNFNADGKVNPRYHTLMLSLSYNF